VACDLAESAKHKLSVIQGVSLLSNVFALLRLRIIESLWKVVLDMNQMCDSVKRCV
jgi:hypothetical protein